MLLGKRVLVALHLETRFLKLFSVFEFYISIVLTFVLSQAIVCKLAYVIYAMDDTNM
jgi:hypothetical protein